MKVIILAGGLPSTLIEENEKMPKPMAEIGGRPLLWHIMKQYAYYGYNDFIICTGYKGSSIKDYFMNFYIYQSDITVDLQTNDIEIHRKQTEDWKVSIVDTGLNSSIIERLYIVRNYISNEPVLVTYGDCLSDINVQKMVAQHDQSTGIATVAVAYPTGRNEILEINVDGTYNGTKKRITEPDAWVNACSMILQPDAFRYFEPGMQCPAATNLMDYLTERGNVQTYRHNGFWSPIETARDKHLMETLWETQKAPWKIWVD